MKQLIPIFVLSLLCGCVNAWSADEVVNLAGTWILDAQNSDPFPHPLPNLGAPQFGSRSLDTDAAPRGSSTPASRDTKPDYGSGGDRSGGGMRGFGSGLQSATPSVPMLIEQNGTDLKISRTSRIQGKEVPVTETYILDGADHAQTTQLSGSTDPIKVVTSAKPKKNSVLVRILIKNPSNKTEVKREFLLSKDGKTLTVKSSTKTRLGDMIQDQVYQKAE
jgi:hypothetical protein